MPEYPFPELKLQELCNELNRVAEYHEKETIRYLAEISRIEALDLVELQAGIDSDPKNNGLGILATTVQQNMRDSNQNDYNARKAFIDQTINLINEKILVLPVADSVSAPALAGVSALINTLAQDRAATLVQIGAGP